MGNRSLQGDTRALGHRSATSVVRQLSKMKNKAAETESGKCCTNAGLNLQLF